MYSTQAFAYVSMQMSWFENDVKMYGTQADRNQRSIRHVFENDVKMYGTQAWESLYEMEV